MEKVIPSKLVIQLLEKDPSCIMVPIHLKMTDTMEEASTEAMVNTGTTGDFIYQDFVNQAKLPMQKLSQPIPVYNVDGTLNEAGSIHKVVNMIITYKGHSEHILLAITQLGKQSMILRMTWLNKHNPEINFYAGTVKMTRCLPQCCISCQTKHQDEHKAEKKQAHQVKACHTGPFPVFVEDAEDEDDKPHATPKNAPFNGPVNPNFPDEPLEEGNHIWATGLFPQVEHICTTATVSQCLAEGFRQNSQPADNEYIPLHLHDFSSVFSKESFDELPVSKPWDHAVELTSNATLKSCKVYPLSVSKQKELDEFLKKNLKSGRI